MPALALHSFSRAIEIPANLRGQPLDAWQTSARLSALLERFGIHVLGDLHGRKVADFAWEKNCGLKTLYELELLARRARFQNGKASCNGHLRGCVPASRTFIATARKMATATIQEDAASFVIPKSSCHLVFNELPITTRLSNVVRSIGVRTLGDLNGRSAFELLQCRACGWGTISEIQQLIERGASGEFDIGRIEETNVAAELLSLLEQGLAKLPLRNRQFVLARIGAQTGSGRGPRANLLCLSYAEIGRRYGLTRARVHKVSANSLDTLRKIRGPRIPRLLEIIKWRCLSTISPLTPQLLERWVDAAAGFSPRATTGNNFSSRFRLSTEAHVRLIGALDKSIPRWLEINHRPRRIDGSVGQFDLALARVVHQAGGHVTIADAYQELSRPTEPNCPRLTIEKFLRMLRSVEYSVLEFTEPHSPVIRLRPSNAQVFLGDGPKQNGKSLTARKVNSNLSVIQFFGTKNGSCERRAVARR